MVKSQPETSRFPLVFYSTFLNLRVPKENIQKKTTNSTAARWSRSVDQRGRPWLVFAVSGRRGSLWALLGPALETLGRVVFWGVFFCWAIFVAFLLVVSSLFPCVPFFLPGPFETKVALGLKTGRFRIFVGLRGDALGFALPRWTRIRNLRTRTLRSAFYLRRRQGADGLMDWGVLRGPREGLEDLTPSAKCFLNVARGRQTVQKHKPYWLLGVQRQLIHFSLWPASFFLSPSLLDIPMLQLRKAMCLQRSWWARPFGCAQWGASNGWTVGILASNGLSARFRLEETLLTSARHLLLFQPRWGHPKIWDRYFALLWVWV